MPNDYIHCLFTGSVVGPNYERRHCWVHRLLDSPAGFLGGRHRILLHDLDTAKKLGTCCWWAGFVAALHIDIDNIPPSVRSHLEDVVKRIRNESADDLPKETGQSIDGIWSKPEQDEFSNRLRNAFSKVHEKVGIDIVTDGKMPKPAMIYIRPGTLLQTTWDYVNQLPPGGRVDGRPFNELPPTTPRIIAHPDLERPETPPHIEECLDGDLLKRLFPDVE